MRPCLQVMRKFSSWGTNKVPRFLLLSRVKQRTNEQRCARSDAAVSDALAAVAKAASAGQDVVSECK